MKQLKCDQVRITQNEPRFAKEPNSKTTLFSYMTYHHNINTGRKKESPLPFLQIPRHHHHRTQNRINSFGFVWGWRRGKALDLEAFEGFLVGPGLDGEIGLGVESDTEDDDGEEAGDVARQLPVFPFPRLTSWWWGPVEEVTLGFLLVTRAAPPARPCCRGAAACAQRWEEPLPDHATHGCCWGWHLLGFGVCVWSGLPRRDREREREQ